MKVLVIAEDPRLDQYMLKPIVEAALSHAGRPRAKVAVCQDARQRGDSTVVGEQQIWELIDDNQLYDVFILCVDRDCKPGRPGALKDLEGIINPRLTDKKFVAVCGIEELEVWVLAGMTDLQAMWADVKANCHPKEAYFDPHSLMRGVADTSGRGRKVLGEEAAKQYATRIRNMCPEVQVCELTSIT